MLGFLGDLLGLNQGDPAIKAAKQNQGLLSGLKTEGMGYIDSGANQATGYLNQALDLYSPLAQAGQQGGLMYANAMGLNGAGGADAARAAFQTGPGYQFALDQGLQALERRAAAQGSLQSGATGIDTMRYATGLADQAWGGWVDRLGNPGTVINSAMGSKAGTLGDLASLMTGAAGKRLDLAGGVTSGMMGANNQKAEGESANKAGLSNLFGKVVGMATGGWF